ncbi:MAG: phosphotransferase family protein, partial [Paracoccaceae bacterium]
TRDGFQQIEQHLASVFRLGARLPPDLDYLLWQAGRAEAAVMASGHDLSPCFNDGYISNYMVNATGDVRIIDWEYASNNDPVWDLAIFCMECFFNAATRNEIVEEYYGTLRHDVLARIDAYEALVCLKWGLWAALQAVVSRIPFDFCKYADLLFMRARGVMRHPRFEAALLKL